MDLARLVAGELDLLSPDDSPGDRGSLTGHSRPAGEYAYTSLAR